MGDTEDFARRGWRASSDAVKSAESSTLRAASSSSSGREALGCLAGCLDDRHRGALTRPTALTVSAETIWVQ
jgi:hypothetical protein